MIRNPRVLLLTMPFVSVSRPSIGISLLKARAEEEGFECHTGHGNLRFAEIIGLDRYLVIDTDLSHALFAGDWLFAQDLFRGQIDTATYLATVKANAGSPTNFESLLEARELVASFLDECIDRFAIDGYDVVGFTSTFQQTLASLALARRIKDRFPEKLTIMGGANCEGVMGMELMRQFPWIDAVFSGESDYSFPEFLRRRATGASVDDVRGLIYRQDGVPRVAGPQDRVHDMDALPDPDFSEYFAAIAASRLKDRINPTLLIESARGCWWGAKSHCTFCGLNGDTMKFRCKSAARTIAELERQSERYNLKSFSAVDNIISHDYFRDFLPALKEKNAGYNLFYEIKSNLRPEQVKLLKEAGVWAVQPGVESLSTPVLKLMKKGVTAIQNIQLLKSCREYKVEAAWNLLFGFPGETQQHYDELAATIPALYHLRPPGAVSPIRLDRFSPNFNNAEEFGLVEVKPFSLYAFLYPIPPEAVANLAYFFEYKHRDGRNVQAVMKNLEEPIRIWKSNRGGDLVKKYGVAPELMVVDTRPAHAHRLYPFSGLQRELYDFCDEIRSLKQILEQASRLTGRTIEANEESVQTFFDQMLSLDLMVREGNQYLSLAIRTDLEYQGLEQYQTPLAA
ncbi:MAG: RiPP maturation radical SAM C-methyltransferase [Bryobacterales bacterium]|nr:RiPP maturation radical SAM C-methyltransferase [Bryobacterales bacterium]